MIDDDDLLDGWPALEPSPGFADRVLGRLPAAPRLALVPSGPAVAAVTLTHEKHAAVALRGTFVFAAVAAAAILILPLALHRRAPAAHAASAVTVAAGVTPDLGLERD